ncbi:MAG: response regulator transcription factor [Candidatus Aminicenantes bacterium]|nr:response regulator transcription factor [Candidatus Aminicenantes bacterium]
MTAKRKRTAPSSDPSRTRILLAEDDPNLGEVIRDLLEIKGYDVVLSRDGEDALRVFSEGLFDLGLIDVMLPRLDGFALARAVRKINSRLPLIFLTAKTMKEDKIEGFKAGGDDYVTKPFHAEELLLRIEAVLRRARDASGGGPNEPVFSLGEFGFDPETRVLERHGRKRILTPKESDLLQLLARHRNQVLDRSAAMRAIWGTEGYFVARSMDVYISKLRKHLAGDPRLEIQNVHGRGFKLVVGREKTR